MSNIERSLELNDGSIIADWELEGLEVMADITMCKGNEEDTSNQCNTCYRKHAMPNEFRQSFLTKVPLEDPSVSCPIHWRITDLDDLNCRYRN